MILFRTLSTLIALSLTSALTLAGCAGGEKTTDSAADDSSSSSTSSSSTTSPGGTTSGGETSSSSGGSTGDSHASHSSGDPTSGATDDPTGDPTGGGSIAESCLDACEVLVGCFPIFRTVEECVTTCVEESTPTEPNPACEAASVAFNKCLASLTCEQLEGEDFPCDAEEESVQELCGGGDECFGGGGIEEDTCSVYEICPDYDYEVQCSAKGCICLEGGVETKTCPPMGDACEDFDTLSAAALACCGWDL